MPVHDFNAERLYVASSLCVGAHHICTREQANYLVNVLRLTIGDAVLVFNGRDGEWRAVIREAARKSCVLDVEACVRPQDTGSGVRYLFAPLKRARLDYMVQKAVEMGVAHLQPVITHRTIVDRVNLDRMRANAIQAAEQCGILQLSEIHDPIKLGSVMADWPEGRTLIYCDERTHVTSPLDVLAGLDPSDVAVLIGPEGGFSDVERAALRSLPQATAISLGPRIMRADTAGVAALTLVNATLGDWR